MRWLTRNSLNLRKISNVPSKVDKQSKSVIAKVNLNNEQDLWLPWIQVQHRAYGLTDP